MVWTGGATGGLGLGFSEEERKERRVEGRERREKRGGCGCHVNTTSLLL